MSSRGKHGRKVLSKYKKRRCTTVNSHVNCSESNHFNTSNNVNVMGNSNLPRTNVQNDSPFCTLINLKKETDTEPIVSINYEINNKNI